MPSRYVLILTALWDEGSACEVTEIIAVYDQSRAMEALITREEMRRAPPDEYEGAVIDLDLHTVIGTDSGDGAGGEEDA